MKKLDKVDIKKIEIFMSKLASEIRGAEKIARLRTCSAEIWESKNFKILRSYNTFVCAIDLNTGFSVDFLRPIYGFTATSGQHIAKFLHDFAAQSHFRLYSTEKSEILERAIALIREY